MRSLHRVAGVILVFVFLGTGVYMRRSFPRIYAGNETAHMMFRANHIYLLFAALINLVLGANLAPHTAGWRRTIQVAGSALVLLMAALLVVAFFVEPVRGSFDRPMTYYGVILLAVGVAVHFVSAIGEKS